MVFTTLNVQGSNDNVGFDAANDAERAKRLAANLAWLAAAVREAQATRTRGLVVIFHANPFVESKQDIYRPYLDALTGAAASLSKPVLLIHGDTHHQRVDQPFKDSRGETIRNLTRMETFGSPWLGWVKVYVDPDDPALFSFESQLFSFEPRLP